MCGIAGIVDRRGAPPDEALLRRMLKQIEHRGPDGEDVWTHGGVGFGHRRLAIIDVTDGGRQPMHFGSLTVLFNGEIYNYLELREELRALGHCFNTDSDTEVLIHCFAQWGEACVHRFRGMWALALYDSANNSLLLSRDRFGIKPLYYSETAEGWLFASEIKALLVAGVGARADERTLASYLTVGLEDHGAGTFYADVKQLLPGHNLRIDLRNDTAEYTRYYELADHVPDSATAEAYMDALRESVRLHLRADVRVATCLSGGLDSSTIAALAISALRRQGEGDFAAFTAKSEWAGNDESPWAEKVVRHCGIPWHSVMATYEDFASSLETCLMFHDEPVGSSSVFLQYWIMKAAAAEGVRVMLDGQGGDETLLGYERYYPVYLRDQMASRGLLAAGGEFFAAVRHSALTMPLLLAYMVYFNSPAARRVVIRRRSRGVQKRFLDMGVEALDDLAPASRDLRTLQTMEVGRFQLPHLLRYEDRNSMAHSVEARVPFLDHECVEIALALAPSDKIQHGYSKYVLRRLAETLVPKEVAWRRFKNGFEAPDRLWFGQHIERMQKTVDGSDILKQLYVRVPELRSVDFQERWRLYNIALWEQQRGTFLGAV
jgi:asparagine synthase (glutamine-hydrolysing)